MHRIMCRTMRVRKKDMAKRTLERKRGLRMVNESTKVGSWVCPSECTYVCVNNG
jgi:hypothetical protein